MPELIANLTSECGRRRDIALCVSGTAWWAPDCTLREQQLTTYKGLPHRLTEDDTYEGMHIPEGSFIFANIWYGSIHT